MANEIISKHQDEVDKAIEHFKIEISGLRTGRANPAMLESVQVESYGVRTPLIQLASISVPEARMLRVEPWDKSITKEIEKAINQANLGVQASVDGQVIRIIIPAMTEENRKDLVKLLKEKLERARVALRSVRDVIKEEIVDGEKNNILTEDDKYRFLEELDKEMKQWNKNLDELAEAKDKEIMTV